MTRSRDIGDAALLPHDRADPASDAAFCAAMLPRVSRTFALGIRLLPPALSHAVGISYLVCRVADTVEDDPVVAIATRRGWLAAVRSALAAPDTDLAMLRGLGQTDDERALMRSADRVFREFWRLPAEERAIIARWAGEMIDGMALTLQLPASGLEPVLESMDDLRRYCYYVAGTVGHLLTGLIRQRVRGIDARRSALLESLATNFGLGLQLTNVIRDLADDHREGRNWVPRTLWRDADLAPGDLFAAGHEAASRRLVEPMLVEAEACLRDALAYSTALPHRAPRVRLFCVAPLFFARRTVTLLRREFARDGRPRRVKMPRREVYAILAVAMLCAPSNTLLRAFHRFLSR